MDFNSNKIKLGCINSKDFDQNVKLLMDRFKNKKCKLNFYSHSIVSSGYKFRETSVSGVWIILELDLPSNSYEYLDYKRPAGLIEKIKDNHDNKEDLIERNYNRNNALGIYYDEEYYIGYPDYFETLDLDVFVDVINLFPTN